MGRLPVDRELRLVWLCLGHLSIMLQQSSGIGYGCAVLQHAGRERSSREGLWFVRPQILDG